MGTYTKETALYDTGAIGTDINAAGQTATNYLTNISGVNGISVHDVNDTSNFVNMNTEGVSIYQGGSSVAQFGVPTRIGSEDNASITIDSDSIVGVGEDGKQFFSFLNSGVTMDVNQGKTVINTTTMASFPHTSSDGRSIAIPDGVKSGSTLRLAVSLRVSKTKGFTNYITFTQGTSQTKNFTVTHESKTYTVYATYTGSRIINNIYLTITGGAYPSDGTIAAQLFYTTTNIAPAYEIGENVSAEGGYSIAIGQNNTANGNWSFAEGESNTANGNWSHACGMCNIASASCQFVIGCYNKEESDKTFIIGGGTSSSSTGRKNILTVDGAGNVDITSGAKYKINGTALSASDVGAVPTTRTVNSKALSSNITLSASDVSAVPTTRTVNGKALSSNITLSASDVSAVPTTRTVNSKALSSNITLAPSDLGISDYITEQGISGIWTWRKWSSGKAECWGKLTGTVASSAWSAWGSVQYCTKFGNVQFPSNLFSEAPALLASITNTSADCWLMYNGNTTATQTCGFYLTRATAGPSSMSYTIGLHAFSA